MGDEAVQESQMTAEEATAIINDTLARESDPIGYEKGQRLAAVDAEFASILAVADDETKVKAQGIINARKADIEAAYASPEPVVAVSSIFSDLGLGIAPGAAKPLTLADGKTVAVFKQFVEPERDGKPWCTWEDAEHMLVQAASPHLRGAASLGAQGYRVLRDEEAMTLALELV